MCADRESGEGGKEGERGVCNNKYMCVYILMCEMILRDRARKRRGILGSGENQSLVIIIVSPEQAETTRTETDREKGRVTDPLSGATTARELTVDLGQ